VMNHTAGLQNAMTDVLQKNPMLMCKWSDLLVEMAKAVPETVPGKEQHYHTLTYGWLCGGIAEV
jgi:aarF domain-containing kinase